MRAGKTDKTANDPILYGADCCNATFYITVKVSFAMFHDRRKIPTLACLADDSFASRDKIFNFSFTLSKICFP